MCLSVNKVETHETISDLMGARPTEKHSNGDCDRGEVENIFISDLLALVTQYTRKSFQLFLAGTRIGKRSVAYKILTRTTQPAHVMSIFIVLLISYCLWPELRSQQDVQGVDKEARSPLTAFLYLSTFAAHFGAQIWMTFVSGLALYFSLPRHKFGKCQEILFPKYFLMSTILSSVTLITFAKMNTNMSDWRWITQMIILSVCVIIEMVVYLYFTPPLLRLMNAKYHFEKQMGNGDEVGFQGAFSGIHCLGYQEINKKFRKIHIKCTMGNLIAMCCTFTHLYYLASKISFL